MAMAKSWAGRRNVQRAVSIRMIETLRNGPARPQCLGQRALVQIVQLAADGQAVGELRHHTGIVSSRSAR